MTIARRTPNPPARKSGKPGIGELLKAEKVLFERASFHTLRQTHAVKMALGNREMMLKYALERKARASTHAGLTAGWVGAVTRKARREARPALEAYSEHLQRILEHYYARRTAR